MIGKRAVALVLFGSIVGTARAGGPSDARVADAIAKGVEFLRGQQQDGAWSGSAYGAHTLGVTALSGLALMENGVARDDPAIRGALDVVRRLAETETETYDLTLAILFLARQQAEPKGPNDPLIKTLARRLIGGQDEAGMWSYTVPIEPPPETASTEESPPKSNESARKRRVRRASRGDNSNTQFGLLGVWAAGRHGVAPDRPLEKIDDHFRSTQNDDGRWDYIPQASPGSPAMNCAGLLGLAISAARPEKAERLTAKARGAALASDPAFVAALREVTKDARRIDSGTDIYQLWSMERVCVALGLRSLDGFDWYAEGASILLEAQKGDGSWSHKWGTIPETGLALLFLRKANLAFELDRVLKMPAANENKPDMAAPEAPAPAIDTKGDADVSVSVRASDESHFPEITLDFEVKDAKGVALLDGKKEDFRVTESDQPVDVLRFSSPQSKEILPATVVLVVDHSESMREENRIDGLKRAVETFLKVMPKGSRVAVVAFSSDVRVLCPFTDDPSKVQIAVDALSPDGFTRYYDAVSAALELIGRESGRRAVLALTDGEDTASKVDLKAVILKARDAGLPVYTVGLGSEDEIESDALKRLAVETRGQYFPARKADELRAVFEQFAVRQGQLYQLTFTTNRKLPDGTLRDVKVYYKASRNAGAAQVFIPGMVVPKAGWSPLFLALLAGLAVLAILPGRLARKSA